MSIFNYCDEIGLQSYRIRLDKTKQGLLRRSRSLKVIEVGTNRKPVCDFLLVINSNWHPISYRFEVIAYCCLNFGHCVLQPSLGGGRLGVNVYHWSYAHWKARSDFLFVLIDYVFASCYGWGTTCENRLKIGVVPRGGSVFANFHV